MLWETAVHGTKKSEDWFGFFPKNSGNVKKYYDLDAWFSAWSQKISVRTFSQICPKLQSTVFLLV